MNLSQPAKFVLVGAGGYVVNLAAFSLLYTAGVRYVTASILSYVLSNALMYLGNRYFPADGSSTMTTSATGSSHWLCAAAASVGSASTTSDTPTRR